MFGLWNGLSSLHSVVPSSLWLLLGPRWLPCPYCAPLEVRQSDHHSLGTQWRGLLGFQSSSNEAFLRLELVLLFVLRSLLPLLSTSTTSSSTSTAFGRRTSYRSRSVRLLIEISFGWHCLLWLIELEWEEKEQRKEVIENFVHGPPDPAFGNGPIQSRSVSARPSWLRGVVTHFCTPSETVETCP